jgi:uncharacterized delta-60 repeat protein
MVICARVVVCLAWLVGEPRLFAQPGLVDTNFANNASGSVDSIVAQPDAKLLVRVYGSGFIRLLRDGAPDLSFQPDLNPGGRIYSAVIQPDGKLLIGGEFSSVQGMPRACLARLNGDGTLDQNFVPDLMPTNPPSGPWPPDPGPTNNISIIVTAPDGKILISGIKNMLRGNGATLPGVARLEPDGSIDNSFPVLTNNPRNVVLQPDGRILMWQDIPINSYEYDSVITRLNPDGSVDSSFAPPHIEGWINALCPLNGKLFIAGYFWRVNGISCLSAAARLNIDGSLDLSFQPSLVIPGSSGFAGLGAAVPQDDGKVIVAGAFTGGSYTNLARLNTDGTIDASYVPTFPNNYVAALAFQPDGKLVAGGYFNTFDGVPAHRLVRLMGDSSSGPALFLFDRPNYEVNENAGAIVLTVRRAWGLQGSVTLDYQTQDGSARAGVRYTAQSGTLVFQDGEFTKTISIPIIDDSLIQDAETFQVVLRGSTGASVGNPGVATVTVLDDDGPAALDPTFNLGIGGLDGTVKTVIQQPDGRLIISGYFQQVGPCGRKGVARLSVDGSLDPTFNPGAGLVYSGEPGWGVLAKLQPDDKILLAGIFTSLNGSARNYLARLNANGSVDTSFDDGTGPSGNGGVVGDIQGLQLLPDGQIIVGGNFNTYNGVNRYGLARLNLDGSVDLSYNSSGTDTVDAFGLQSDGKVVYVRTWGSQVARLNPDGSTESASFATVSGVSHTIRQIDCLADGSTIIAGSFAMVSGQPRNCLARLLLNGTVDSGFVPDLSLFQGSPFAYVYKFAAQSDGKLLAAIKSNVSPPGDYLIRLNSNGTLDTDFEPVRFTIPSGDNETICSITIQTDGGIVVGGEFQSVNGLSRPYLVRLKGIGKGGTRPMVVKSLRLINSQPQLVLSVPPGKTVVLQASTNLSDWAPISTNTVPVSTFTVSDVEAGNSPLRFYRIVERVP